MSAVPVPGSIDFHYDWLTIDESAPLGADVDDVFRGIPADERRPHRVTSLVVSVFPDGTPSTCGANGLPLTKSGSVDRRSSYAMPVWIAPEIEQAFIAASEARIAR